ncbi:HVA22-LIKE PROTEINS [Salix koriyanagi]|uniref:HVA22-like protein n=1 Tax=Salix koriyanagi TaxID=2511006 RepID=A0A9Q0WBM7_9ROSI|nr:HVA22-LIKE PROTEINS [Salix koriyanagi]
MSRLLSFLTQVHTISGPVLMLLYPLYASVIAIESPNREDDKQWLAYWILYSFLTLTEMLLQPLLEWITLWYSLKLVLAAWLVLPHPGLRVERARRSFFTSKPPIKKNMSLAEEKKN